MSPQQFGGFEILDELGRGGMGIVYRARQLSLDRTVALKVLPFHNRDTTTVARFKREAYSMAQLHHPSIVDVIEVGEQSGVPFFAMQYIEGRGLDAIIQHEGALPAQRAATIAAEVADALQHAHEQGVIHRDIKPANILISTDGRPVVTDFGIAKAVENAKDQVSLTQGAIGTPEYMSPEVIRGNPIDGRADLYSLGIVLYQMVVGHAPFAGTTPFQIADLHLRAVPPAPSEVAASCPEWLESIILRALAKEPTERFGSAAEMAAALRSSRPVAAPTVAAMPRSTVSMSPAIGAPAQAEKHSGSLIRILAAIGVVVLAVAAGLVTAGIRSERPVENARIGAPAPEPAATMVPAVVGQKQDTAERMLGDAGLSVQYGSSPHHS